MSDLFTQAVARRSQIMHQLQELRQEARKLEKEMAELDGFLATWRKLSGTSGEQSTQAESTPVEYVPVILPAPKPPVNPPREKIGDAAEAILKERGRPMTRTDLFNEIKRRGLEIHGKDPEMVFSTMLWRMQDRFVRLPKFGYWLKKEPCSVVGYLPSSLPTTVDIFAD